MVTVRIASSDSDDTGPMPEMCHGHGQINVMDPVELTTYPDRVAGTVIGAHESDGNGNGGWAKLPDNVRTIHPHPDAWQAIYANGGQQYLYLVYR